MSQEAMRREMEELNARTAGVQPQLNDNDELPANPLPPEEPEVSEESKSDTSVTDARVSDTSVTDTSVTDTGVRAASVKEYNFTRLREQNRELERKVAEMQAYLQKSAKKDEPVEEVIEDFEIKDDDIAEGKHLKSLKKQVKILNEVVIREKEERAKLATETKLRANYPDLFNVVTKENMEQLNEMEPDLVASIVSSPDIYAQHVSAYKLIKKYGIGTQDPYLADKNRAQKNLAKPKSAATVSPRQGESALAEADRFASGLTDDLKAQLIREMDEAIANRT